MQFRDAPTERIVKNKLTSATLGCLFVIKYVFVHDFQGEHRKFDGVRTRRATNSEVA
jgi:hypothetical protein